MDEKKMQELIEKVKNSNRQAAWELAITAYGQDITPAIPTLVNALEDNSTRKYAIIALTVHYIDKGEWDKVGGLLNHKNTNVEIGTAQVLDGFVYKCNSIERLNEAQKAVENSFREWLKKQPPGPSSEKIERMIGTSKRIMDISERKAELVKEKGTLSLGTVKKPKKNGRKIYRIGKAVRNG